MRDRSKKINLVYWNKANFGDQLSPYIIHKLSGCPIQYKRGPVSLRHSFGEIFANIITFKWKSIQEMLFNWQNNILAVGSIINLGNNNSYIWGSGFMSQKQKCHGGKFYAVRGKFTDQKLKSEGLEGCNTYGDPALLLPLIYHPLTKNKTSRGGGI